ncbi:MAG: membrane protein [Saprospiraceae bacterium]|nr:MAG: membrane protein [Saprospiraceae bacterium]
MNRLFILILIAISLISCNKVLEDIQPKDQLPIAAAFNSIEELEAALVGTYDALQNPDLAGRSLLFFSDLLSGNIRSVVSADLLEIANLEMNTNNSFIADFWIRAYQAINQLNLILSSLPVVAHQDGTADTTRVERMEGEAQFLRGLLYFELVRFFGQPYGSDIHPDLGVPLLLNPITSQENLSFTARASIAEVYQQIIKDFNVALPLLPEINPMGRGRANQFVVLAYLARVAFQQEQYGLAAQYCDTLLADGKYTLTPEPADFFVDEGSSEEIWTVISTPEDDLGFMGLTAFYHPNSGTGTITQNLKMYGYNAIATEAQLAAQLDALPSAQLIDLRYYGGPFFNPSLISADSNFTLKYEDADNYADDAPMVRLAEFLLMRAEIRARDGEITTAIELLNQVRQRALRLVDDQGGLIPNGEQFFLFNPDDFSNMEALLEIIHRERRVELAFEGNYFHDLMRRRADVQGLPYDAEALRFPIPQREIDVNPNLVQNPGY